MPLTPKKKLPVKKRSITKKNIEVPKIATPKFDGRLPKSAKEYRDDLMMIPVADRPDHPTFPRVNPKGVPPETYYVYDPEDQRCTHMVSLDPISNSWLAWDSDRDGRYFTRVPRPLLCPRSIEYAYDTSVAQLAGEHWSHSHKNYLGSLSGRIDAEPYTQTPQTRKMARTAPSAAKTTGLSRKGAAAKPATPPLKPKRSLKPREADSDLLNSKGLDRKRLQSTAEDLVKDYDRMFGESVKAPAKKRPLPRKKKRS
ncbi:hypothetical protein SEA_CHISANAKITSUNE_82 [Gordonia phage ChisanaKitsune]|uniref:Uncharacterized protein n=1 Tax=Gordonia phage ChisanaKitsune TaxID=2871538 RepID=A0AAE7XH08_9CAUD|nr:hypothetical protein PQD15_gp082 [Gordonia phage ChisanaKitsune]QZE10848.1 hypothetical protein SEA_CHISANAKITSUNE_82 [Gordonia phage ChisanaKitsune]